MKKNLLLMGFVVLLAGCSSVSYDDNWTNPNYFDVSATEEYFNYDLNNCQQYAELAMANSSSGPINLPPPPQSSSRTEVYQSNSQSGTFWTQNLSTGQMTTGNYHVYGGPTVIRRYEDPAGDAYSSFYGGFVIGAMLGDMRERAQQKNQIINWCMGQMGWRNTGGQ